MIQGMPQHGGRVRHSPVSQGTHDGTDALATKHQRKAEKSAFTLHLAWVLSSHAVSRRESSHPGAPPPPYISPRALNFIIFFALVFYTSAHTPANRRDTPSRQPILAQEAVGGLPASPPRARARHGPGAGAAGNLGSHWLDHRLTLRS